MNDFKAAIDSKMSKVPTILTNSNSGSSTLDLSIGLSSSSTYNITEEGLSKAIPTINNADVSADYVLKLKKELVELASRSFSTAPSDLERVWENLNSIVYIVSPFLLG